MKQMYGYSKNGDVEQAVAGFRSPAALVFFADAKHIEAAAAALKSRFPEAVSIGCVGQWYAGEGMYEDGLEVVGYEDVKAVAGVIDHVGTMPLAGIEKFRKDVEQIAAGKDSAICLDFTTGNDAQLVTTLNIALLPKGISLIGGTAWEDTVACNGVVYHDACVYLLLHNLTGKIRAYRENLYVASPDSPRYVATKVDPSRNALFELGGKPAKAVYEEMVGVQNADLYDQTMKNPLGRVIGDEIYLIALNEAIENGGFTCYKKINAMDIITTMELGDVDAIIQDTLSRIRADFPQIQGLFSVNCIYRHSLFQEKNMETRYLQKMNSLGSHVGLIGLGEHFNTQHVNQTMSGFAFD